MNNSGLICLKKGDVLIHEGDASTQLYFLLEGQLDVTTRGIRINIINQDEMFGELAHILNIPRTATVSALVDCKVLAVSMANIYNELHELPEWAQKFVVGLMKKIVNLTNQIASQEVKNGQ